jgi:ABC-type branched-subunit amino acid transport system ATPase component
MFRTKQSSFLFEPFTKLGINLHKILLGISEDNSKLYLDSALIGHLSRLGQDIQTQMVLYLVSVMHMFIELNTIQLKDNYFMLSKLSSSELRVKETIFSSLNRLVKSFNSDIKIEILETESSKIDYIELTNDTFAANLPISVTGQIPTSYLLLKNNFKNYSLLFKTVSNGYYRVNLSNGEIVTNLKLSYIDFDSDSTLIGLSGSMTMCSNPITVSYNETLQMASEAKFTVIESISEIEDTDVRKQYEEFITKLSEVREITETVNLEDVYKTISKDYFDTASSSYVSNDSIKVQYKDDAYAQELYKINKKVIDKLGPVDLQELSNIVPSVIKGETYSAIFVGESGTGKSTTAKHIAYMAGIPFEIINASINIEESDFIGIMVSNKNRKSDLDPMFVWKDGILARAVRHGYVVIIEELNFARAGVLGKLNTLMDDSRQIELGDGSIIQAHPNFRLFATGNIGEEGTQRLNRALINRFQHAKKFKHLNKQEAIALILSKTGYKDHDKVDKIYSVYDAIRKYAKENQLKLSISIRQLLNIFMAPKVYKSAYDAVVNFMINQAFLEETEHQEHFMETVLSVFDLKFKL